MTAQLTVTRFCEVLGIPRPTWYRWRAASSNVKGPWPTPAQDAIEADAKALAATWDGWGHRKLAELLRTDGTGREVADSTMFRVLDRNGLALPANYTGEVRQLARLRKETFISPPTRRNRLWQADFSDFETDAAGDWVLGGVADYWAKVALACTLTIRKTADDAIAMFEAALLEVEVLLGVTWVEDLTDPTTGEIGRLRIVTDNGPASRVDGLPPGWRPRNTSSTSGPATRRPWTNGVIERWFRSVKYERLYRREISDGLELARQVDDYLGIFNSIRPHEAIGMKTPLSVYRQTPKPNFPDPGSVSEP